MDFWNTIVNPHWIGFVASISEINADFSGKEEDILHPGEINVLADIRSKSYREAWFAGRVLAKQCCGQQSEAAQRMNWNEMQIVSRNAAGKSVAPRLLVQGRETGLVFSLSHVADRVAVVALMGREAREHTGGLAPARSCGIGIGCDLVFQHAVTPGIVKTFFHDDEVKEHSNFDAIWAVKEAAYKSCNENEPFQPRQWLMQRVEENRYFCRHLDEERQLFAEAETLPLGDYTLAVAKKSSLCYTTRAFSG